MDLELGLIGNCQVAALVDRLGCVVWGAFPRIDGDPFFCALLGATEDEPAARGFFDVQLIGVQKSEQRYIRNTAILETVLHDAEGNGIRIADFIPRYRRYGRMFYPMTLVRRIHAVRGKPAIRIRLRGASEYGGRAAHVAQGNGHIRYGSDGLRLRLTTDAPLSALVAEEVFGLDEPISMILGPDEVVIPNPRQTAGRMYEKTRAYWEGWTRALSIPFEWQEEVIRAAITLKLCTYEDTGAVVAAVTTSIPEAPHTTRNWDYRYCWLRDSYYVVHALNRLGATKTMEKFLRYLSSIVAELGSAEKLQPVYGINRQADLTERTVTSLPGYRGMAPVRVGNGAYRQRQNDIFGAVVLAATQLFFDRRLRSGPSVSEFRRLEALGERAAALFDQPDASLWEFRGREAVHTYSSVMCWAACDRLGRIAQSLGLEARAVHWSDVAQRIRGQIVAQAWSAQRNSFVATFGGDDVDASLLTLADVGFVQARDPRFLGTLAACESELKRGPYLLRYSSSDDFGKPQTAFNICTFWYIGALAAVGRRDEARMLFRNMLSRRTALGLLSEDLDPETGELWGNFPQTYSMVGIITVAMRLSRSWEEAI